MTEGVGYNSTMKKRALSRRLVELRKDCELTASEVSKRLEWSEGKLSYIERSMWIRPNPRDVRDLCELYGIDDDRERDALIQLARDARERGWWRRYNDVLPSELPGLEGGAELIRTYESQLIPGLLQVPRYTELVIRTKVEDKQKVQRRLAARDKRRQVLARDDDPPKLHAVFDEAALLRISDPEISKEQVTHLITMARQDNITVQMVPIERGLYAGIGEVFVILDFPDPQERTILFLETHNDERYLEEHEEIERYIVRFKSLCVDALSPDETLTFLRRIE